MLPDSKNSKALNDHKSRLKNYIVKNSKAFKLFYQRECEISLSQKL